MKILPEPSLTLQTLIKGKTAEQIDTLICSLQSEKVLAPLITSALDVQIAAQHLGIDALNELLQILGPNKLAALLNNKTTIDQLLESFHTQLSDIMNKLEPCGITALCKPLALPTKCILEQALRKTTESPNLLAAIVWRNHKDKENFEMLKSFINSLLFNNQNTLSACHDILDLKRRILIYYAPRRLLFKHIFLTGISLGMIVEHEHALAKHRLKAYPNDLTAAILNRIQSMEHSKPGYFSNREDATTIIDAVNQLFEDHETSFTNALVNATSTPESLLYKLFTSPSWFPEKTVHALSMPASRTKLLALGKTGDSVYARLEDLANKSQQYCSFWQGNTQQFTAVLSAVHDFPAHWSEIDLIEELNKTDSPIQIALTQSYAGKIIPTSLAQSLT